MQAQWLNVTTPLAIHLFFFWQATTQACSIDCATVHRQCAIILCLLCHSIIVSL